MLSTFRTTRTRWNARLSELPHKKCKVVSKRLNGQILGVKGLSGNIIKRLDCGLPHWKLLHESNSSTDYFSIGCWRDQPERTLPSLEGIFAMLDGNDYMSRKFAVKKCSTIARVQGFPAFALENSGQCLGGEDILQTYMYGASSACKPDGRGGPWSMEVYKFTSK